MSKICYVKKNFSRKNLDLINRINEIIDLYKESDAKPTLLKIFNKLVNDGVLEGGRQSHKRLASVVGNARISGLIGWDDMRAGGRNMKGILCYENMHRPILQYKA